MKKASSSYASVCPCMGKIMEERGYNNFFIKKFYRKEIKKLRNKGIKERELGL
jgi:hypothetical protein